jgi:hypothetical protein
VPQPGWSGVASSGYAARRAGEDVRHDRPVIQCASNEGPDAVTRHGTRRGPTRVVSTRPAALAVTVALLLAGGALAAVVAGGPGTGVAGEPGTGTAVPPSAPSAVIVTATDAPGSVMTPAPTLAPAPAPTPEPTPEAVTAPLTGLLVPPELAAMRPIAVMIDDQRDARPQSGFTDAAIVWHAPAEGGIPRYMLVFQERVPGVVGPVRSARQYYIGWAAEWRAMYVHGGGSPQSLATLRAEGTGQLVYTADEFRWGRRYLWRVRERSAPHNVYTDGDHLRQLAAVLKVPDELQQPAWSFEPDPPTTRRPQGGRIELAYPANRIAYDYDRATNTWLRSVGGEPHLDAASDMRVAPKNVVILFMRFGALQDGKPEKQRLEAGFIGSGNAIVATGGRTIEATWRKDSMTGPTRLLDGTGQPVPMAAGQTFVQVLPIGSRVTITEGTQPPGWAGGPNLPG